ncbi:MAG TPA: O-antigen ligase family protein [bacterium]|jgi:O-antigen ligase|nr:O-antigen ligase family protein [bacterium]
MSLLGRLRVTQSKHLYFLLTALLLPMYFLPSIRKGVSFFHVVNVAILGGYLLTFILAGKRPRWYFLLPIWVYMVGSLTGMFNSQALGINLYTLAQDVYLYVWFVALCVIMTSQDDVNYLAAAWCVAAVLVMMIGFFGAGVTESVFREEFTFRNPNRASAYFMTTMAMMFAPVFNDRRWLRGAMIVLSGFAVWSTGSIGTFASFAVGAAVLMSVTMYLRTGGFWVARQAAVLLLAGLAVYASVTYADIESTLASRIPASFGRAARSYATRQEIWAAGLDEFRQHPFGIGPASFFQQVELGRGLGTTGSLELHSDYVATLVERGVVGLSGLLLLIVMVGRELIRLVRTVRGAGRRDLQLWSGALCGAMVGYFTYSLTHEALHHDTLWLLLAIVMVQLQILRRDVRVGQRRPSAPPDPVPVRVGAR